MTHFCFTTESQTSTEIKQRLLSLKIDPYSITEKKDRASIHVNLAVLISNATPIFPRRMDSVSKSGSLSSKFFPPSIRRHRPRGFFSDGFMYLFSPTKSLILSHIWEIIHDLAYKCQLFLSALSITPKQCSKS